MRYSAAEKYEIIQKVSSDGTRMAAAMEHDLNGFAPVEGGQRTGYGAGCRCK